MEYNKWAASKSKEAATILVMLLAAAFLVFAILHHLAPISSLYLFLRDLFHQVLFYIGGVLALVELLMLKFLETPLEKKLFTALALLCLFVASFQAWIDEHHNAEDLIKDKYAMAQEREFWKGQSYAKDDSLRKRDELLSQNFGTLSGTQNSLTQLSNKILDINKKEPLSIHPIPLMPGKNTLNSVAQNQKVFVLLTNKIIVPVHLLVKCDKPIVMASGGILGSTMTLMNDSWPGARSETTFGVGAGGGTWGPLSPMTVTVFYNEGDDRKCSFDEQ